MTVGKLIKELSKLDAKAIVLVDGTWSFQYKELSVLKQINVKSEIRKDGYLELDSDGNLIVKKYKEKIFVKEKKKNKTAILLNQWSQ